MDHHRSGRGEQEPGGDAHRGELHSLEPVVVVIQRVAVGQGPVVVDVQIGDPVRRARLLRVAVGQCLHDGLPCRTIAAGPAAVADVEGAALERVAGVVLEEGDRGVGLVPAPVGVRPDVRIAGRDPRLSIDDQVLR